MVHTEFLELKLLTAFLLVSFFPHSLQLRKTNRGIDLASWKWREGRRNTFPA